MDLSTKRELQTQHTTCGTKAIIVSHCSGSLSIHIMHPFHFHFGQHPFLYRAFSPFNTSAYFTTIPTTRDINSYNVLNCCMRRFWFPFLHTCLTGWRTSITQLILHRPKQVCLKPDSTTSRYKLHGRPPTAACVFNFILCRLPQALQYTFK